jgi:hypothetical protein
MFGTLRDSAQTPLLAVPVDKLAATVPKISVAIAGSN